MIAPIMRRAITRNAIILGLFAITTAGTLALTNNATKGKIACNRQQALESSLLEVMPSELANNNLLADWIRVEDPLLGRGEQRLYRARLQTNNSGFKNDSGFKNNFSFKNNGAVIEAVAADGYGGSISLLIGITLAGEITGVRVVPPHNETPGLGDKIELKKSDWILSFNGKSLANTEERNWAVTKDGGDFDSFTGATITPRAVVAQVHKALRYFEAHKHELFDKAPNTEEMNTETCHD